MSATPSTVLNSPAQFDPGASRNLDVVRMIAVLMVVQGHLFRFWGDPNFFGWFQPFSLGRFGVVLFFVHTSLVLMASMDRQWKKTGRHRFFLIFLIRRGFRIFPLAIAAILLTIEFGFPSEILPHHFTFVTRTPAMIVANLGLFQNFITGTSIIGVQWSLAYEWQMYIALPVFFLIARRATSMIPLLIIWSLPITISMGYGNRFVKFNKIHHFIKIPLWYTYAPCFIAGVLAFYIATKMKTEMTLPPAALWATIAVLSLPMLAYAGVDQFAPATLPLAFAIPYCREIKFSWFSKFARIVVRYSYGIYLFHMIAMDIGFRRLRLHSLTVQWLAFAAVTIIAPVILYHALEHPMIQLGNRIAKALEGGGRRSAVSLERSPTT